MGIWLQYWVFAIKICQKAARLVFFTTHVFVVEMVNDIFFQNRCGLVLYLGFRREDIWSWPRAYVVLWQSWITY